MPFFGFGARWVLITFCGAYGRLLPTNTRRPLCPPLGSLTHSSSLLQRVPCPAQPLDIRRWQVLAAVIAVPMITGSASAQVRPDSSMIAPEQRIYSPYVERTARNGAFAEGLYWGDTHLHTSWSMDAGMVGNRVGPEDAFRFARGEEILTSTGQRSRLIRPLDFLVVADHAENVGIPPLLAEANPDLLATEYGRRFYDLYAAGDGYEAYTLWGNDGVAQNRDVINDPRINRTMWERTTAVADAFDDPGTFTAFIGYEWTSINNMTLPGNLHRILVFRDDASKANQILPFSTFDSEDPEDLWELDGRV